MKVSVVIPCRNEFRFIRDCLNSLVEQDMPKDQLEIFVVDGMSDDGTIEIINEFAQKYTYIKLIPNPNRITPIAFNLGYNASTGDYVGFIGAHATYEPSYISKIIQYLETHPVDCVGGLRINIPRETTFFAKSWILAITHPFGVGDSHFNTGSLEPISADTAACSFYRRNVFEKIGLFNEKLIHSQDMEFNRRLKENGGEIILYPGVSSTYFTRTKALEVIKYAYKNGKWSILPYKWCKNALSLRHLIPLMFVSGLLFGSILSIWYFYLRIIYFSVITLYFTLAILSAIQLCKKSSWKYLSLLPIQFFMQHFFYGLGSLVAVSNLFFSKEFYKKTDFNNQL